MPQGGLQLNVPLYQGGGEYASIRQAKEQLGQARRAADLQRVEAHKDVLSSYAKLKAAKAAIESGNEVVKAAETALRGVRLEASVGQRTVLDVLNAQQALLEARVRLVGYQPKKGSKINSSLVCENVTHRGFDPRRDRQE